jgi:hypothetical protein
MKTTGKNVVATKFNKLDFHDDTLIALRVYPPRSRNNLTNIDFEFRDDSTTRRKTLSFRSCANFRFVMDFDVLADQWFFGTHGSRAHADPRSMLKFVRNQMPHWRVEYMPPMPKDKPIRRKLQSIRNYMLFRIAFFGGTAEILAKRYTIK